jgi:hypothetical protein
MTPEVRMALITDVISVHRAIRLSGVDAAELLGELAKGSVKRRLRKLRLRDERTTFSPVARRFCGAWGGKDHRSLANAAHRETEKSDAAFDVLPNNSIYKIYFHLDLLYRFITSKK